MVGLSDFARYGQDGTTFSDSQISFPFQLILEPAASLQTAFPDTYQKPLIDQLRSIPSGSLLYKVYAKDVYDSIPELIGELVLTSPIESSVYADTRLFLKHQLMDEDLALRPDWTKVLDVSVGGMECPSNPFSSSSFALRDAPSNANDGHKLYLGFNADNSFACESCAFYGTRVANSLSTSSVYQYNYA